MTRGGLGAAIVALGASLGAFTVTSQAQQPASKAQVQAQNVPAEYQAGIAQLRAAKGYLEKAGDKWGGHRVNAIAAIDKALTALGLTTESTPAEMQSGNVDEPNMLNQGISGLKAAKADFAKAGDNWGGRKAKGVALIDQALQELQQGIKWAKEHKTY